MLVTTNRLIVEVSHCPKKAKKTAEETARMVQKILSQFNYVGKWKIVLVSQITKRSDFKFQVIARRGQTIVCRTKPGDNGTCWETALWPPQGYILDQIYSDLRMVPPNGEMEKKLAVPKISVSPLILSTPVATSVKEETTPTAKEEKVEEKKVLPPPPPASHPALPVPVFKKEVGIVQTEAPKSPPIQTGTSLAKPIIAPVKVEEEPVKFLSLAGVYVDTVGESSHVKNKGFFAVCFGIDPIDGSVSRQMAIQLLIQHLDLPAFVKTSQKYSDPVRSASMIIKGLVRDGLLSRWNAAARKEKRTRIKTKGYILTPVGRAKLEELKQGPIYDHIKNSLFHPEKVQFVSIVDIPDESDDETENNDIDIEKIQPLFTEYNKINAAISEWDQLAAELESNRKPLEGKLADVERQLIEFDQEIKVIQARRQNFLQSQAALLQEDKKLSKELEAIRAGKAEDEAALKALKTKLKLFLNKD